LRRMLRIRVESGVEGFRCSVSAETMDTNWDSSCVVGVLICPNRSFSWRQSQETTWGIIYSYCVVDVKIHSTQWMVIDSMCLLIALFSKKRLFMALTIDSTSKCRSHAHMT
jgi:hypothetical protein